MEAQTKTILDYAVGENFPVKNICGNEWCPKDHGTSLLQLRWYYSEPTTVFVRAGVHPQTGEFETDFVVSRELLLTALRSGTGTGFPVIGEGNVMCQVPPDRRSLLCLAFNGGYMVLIERWGLTDWLMGTYVHVPPDQEERVLDIDHVVAQLLYS